MNYKCFAKFYVGDTILIDGEHSARSIITDDEQIKTLIENNPRYTTREIAEILKIALPTVLKYLHQLNYVNHYDVWVPHDLRKKNLMDRITVSDSLLKRNDDDSFFNRMVTGNEKLIIDNNVKRKKSWDKRNQPSLTTPKALP